MKSIYREVRLVAFLRHAVIVLFGLSFGAAASAAEHHSFLLQSVAKDKVAAAVEAMGGQVTHQYDNIDALAVSIPATRRSELFAIEGVDAVYKDQIVGAPLPAKMAQIDASAIQGALVGDALQAARAEAPNGYVHHLIASGADDLQAAGLSGAGVLVAIIDSGTANVFSIGGNVIGGENFVAGPGEPSATSTLNGNHGTWVGTTMSAAAGFCFFTTSGIVQSLLVHDPDSILVDACGPGVSAILTLGPAPGASIYAMKVFTAAGGGTATSIVIAAMDRAITIRRNYNDGMPAIPVSGTGTEDDPFVFDSAPIEIVNMSLGGATLFAGGDLEDQMTEAMLDVGITLVASAGNSGHAAMTGGSPGTGTGSLTSGAASFAINERVFIDVVIFPGAGELYRATSHTQVATFSSRGPTADGRIDPDNVTAGDLVLAQGADGGLYFVSGTSFSAPNTSGGAALLREADPDASAQAIRDALIHTSNIFEILGAGPFDQGSGIVDYVAALGYLQDAGGDDDDSDSDSDSDGVSSKVAKNILRVGARTLKLEGGSKTMSVDNLVPGEVAHFFIESSDRTDALRFEFSNVTPALGPGDQNAFFRDDLFIEIVDAMTSDDALVYRNFVASNTAVDIENPQTGIVRVAIMGDWTNAGSISADLTITETRNHQGEKTDSGKVTQGEFDIIGVDVPDGAAEVVFELAWKENWGHYPTNDLDMFLVSPGGSVNFDGATLASPERVVFNAPVEGGTWTVFVDGFTIHDGLDNDDDSDSDGDGVAESKWQLRVTADGTRIE